MTLKDMLFRDIILFLLHVRDHNNLTNKAYASYVLTLTPFVTNVLKRRLMNLYRYNKIMVTIIEKTR